MMPLNPYLTFDGTCAEAFELYATVLGGTLEMMMTHGESPMTEQTAVDAKNRIMHAQLRLGPSGRPNPPLRDTHAL